MLHAQPSTERFDFSPDSLEACSTSYQISFFFSLHTVFTAEGKFLRNPQPAMKMYCVYICMHSYICIYAQIFFSGGGVE